MTRAGGGAERVLADVANGLVARGHSVSLISFDAPGRPPFYPLDPQIRRIDLGIGSVTEKATAWSTLLRIRALRRHVGADRPDIAIGFMHSMFIPLGMALVGTGIPVIASEHIVPEHYRSRPLEAFLLNLTPLLVDRITCVSQQVVQAYPAWLRRKMIPILNPISAPTEKRAQMAGGARKILLSVGRLEAQKDYDTLIRAFALLHQDLPDWDLSVVGEGHLRPHLERLVADLKLEGRVRLPGATADVQGAYLSAQLFVQSSRYESFGLSMAEALSCGLPAVGFDDCPGINVLIRPGFNGVLARAAQDRARSLADALKPLMQDPALRTTLAGNAPASVEEYRLDRTLDNWERLFREMPAAG